MDSITHNAELHFWLTHYGSVALFILLALGIIALPVPEETLMVLAGVLMNQDQLPIPQTIIAAYFGSLCGITTSFTVGKTAGYLFIRRYTRWMGVEDKHLQKAQAWFKRFGKWSLLIGYFIPGFRHFMGIFAGVTSLPFQVFALFAYSGALVWVSLYLSIGYFFGQHWFALYEKLFKNIETSMEYLIIAGVVALIIYWVYKVKTS